MQPAWRVITASRTPGSFACGRCLTRLSRPQRRAVSHLAPRHAAPQAPSPAGLAELSSRRLISVSGPDAAKYLQGVITANLFPGPHHASPPLRSDAGFYAAFLTAQGRVLHDVFIYRDVRDTSNPAGHSWLLEVDAAEAERLHTHIRRYRLRAKFDVRLLDKGEAAVWHAWNDNDNNASHPFPPPTKADDSAKLLTIPDTRAPNLGHRLLTFNTTSQPLPFANSLPLMPEESYHLRRYLHGIPEGQSEILRDQALPHESNIDVMGGVDFRKGCYVGQELTIRTEHRGVVRKRVLPCLLYPDGAQEASVPTSLPHTATAATSTVTAPPPGPGLLGLGYRPEVERGVAAEMVPAEASIGRVGKKGRSAGKWLKGVGNLGLALCRLEIMTDVVLPGETGGGGFEAGDEFVVGLGKADGGEEKKVKIKAFVPEWLRAGLARNGAH